MNDPILERWNTMSVKDRQDILDKFEVFTLEGVMKHEKLREYIKENFMKSKLIRRGE
jgi:hypothetical protein